MTNLATHRSPKAQEIDRLIPSRALPALLDFWTLCDFIGMRKDRSSRLFFWRGAKAGTCPSPVKLSEARIAWRRVEWERWLSERPRPIYAKAKKADAEDTGAEPERPPLDSEPLRRAAVTVTIVPRSCADCGGSLTLSGGALYLCADVHGLGCDWRAVVLEDGTDAA